MTERTGEYVLLTLLAVTLATFYFGNEWGLIPLTVLLLVAFFADLGGYDGTN